VKAANHLVCDFLRRCIRRMQALGLNNTQLAKRLNVSRPYVTKLLSGDVNISFAAAERLAKALEMDFLPGLNSHTKKAKNSTLQRQSSVALAKGEQLETTTNPTSSLHADNTIYLMHLVSRAYAHAHSLSRQEFNARDAQFNILRYVATCPSVFDALPEAEMVKEVDRYVSRCA